METLIQTSTVKQPLLCLASAKTEENISATTQGGRSILTLSEQEKVETQGS
ncbi:unnamed protein product [Dovyalis caffra]|uniref:Uncharacterized protein n=1 Tax=Dovyalis caffra TaxID=77055 RepID=A0AAV1RYU1_9ROSI|nr:unnamed protein product [Dovyalis caffra]